MYVDIFPKFVSKWCKLSFLRQKRSHHTITSSHWQCDHNLCLLVAQLYDLSFLFGFLYWSSSWWWRPHIGRCRLLLPLPRAEMTDLDQIFGMRYFLCIWRAPFLSIFFYSDPLKKVVLSEVGASPKMLSVVSVQHVWRVINTIHILILCKMRNLGPGGV